MARGPKSLIVMGLGLLDYLRDKWEELQDEIVERGEERSEDIREFFGDLRENIPLFKGRDAAEAEWDEPEEEEDGALGGLIEDVDVKSALDDLMERIGLATPEDIKELKDRLERLGRAIENIEN
jgi:polyhydroxyalkanoate synthesis regulator phasin